MADIADQAGELIERRHEELLERLRQRHTPPPNLTGRCKSCREAIEPERLERQPNAERCTECQTSHETRRKHYAHE